MTQTINTAFTISRQMGQDNCIRLKLGFVPCSTAKVILGQVLSSVTCGSRTTTQRVTVCD